MLRRALLLLLLLLSLSLLAGCGPIAGAIIVAVESGGGSSGGGGGGAPPPLPPGPTPPPNPDDPLPPLASIQVLVSTFEDVPVTVEVPTLTPEGEQLSYVLESSPSFGTVSGQPPNLTYTPQPNWNGRDQLTYRILAGSRSAQAQVSIDVASVNDPPLASPLAYELPEDGSTPVTLAGSDVEGQPLTFELVFPPGSGTVTGTGASRTYTPDPGFVGNDAFTYRTIDPEGAASAATVQLTVRPQLRITSVTPDRGDRLGGTRLTITGARFSPATQVTIAGDPAASVAVIDSATIECDAPGGRVGYAAVEVSEPGSYSASDDDAYFYEGWEDPRSNLVQAPGGTTDAYAPSLVATPTGELACVWIDRRTLYYVIRFATSTDEGQTWSPSVVINDASGVKESLRLAVSPSGTLGCLWHDDSNNVLYFTRSQDGGQTWSTPVLVDDGSDKNAPALVMEAGGAIICAWHESRPVGARVVFSRSVDGGATWSPDTLIDPLATSYQGYPYLTTTSAGLACVYNQHTLTSGGSHSYNQIVLAQSNDGGASWTLSRVDDHPDSGGTQGGGLLVEAPGGVLHSAWYSGGIRVSRSFDGGATWSPSQELIFDSGVAPHGLVAHPAGGLILSFTQDDDVLVYRSLDGGISWSPPIRVDDDDGPEAQSNPSLTVLPDGTLACAWTDERRGNQDVFCSRSGDAGSTWAANARVDDDTVEDEYQRECVVAFEPDGSILVAWEDTRGPASDVYLTRSQDRGATWEPNQRLGEDNLPFPWGDMNPTLVVDPSGAWLAAWARSNNTLVFRRSDDRGASWSDEVVVTPVGSRPGAPQLSLEPAGALVCAWLDNSDDPTTLQFATSLDGGLHWSAPQQIATPDWGGFSLATGPSEWVCAWIERTSSGSVGDVVVGRSVDQGATWTRDPRTPGSGSDRPSSVSLARRPGGTYVVVWSDDEDGIYTIRSTDQGVTWTNAFLLEPGGGSKVGIASGPGGNLAAAWDAEDSYYLHSLHVTRSLDGAVTWTPILTGFTWPPPVPLVDTRTTFERVAIGPEGQVVVIGFSPGRPSDPVFLLGWWRP